MQTKSVSIASHRRMPLGVAVWRLCAQVLVSVARWMDVTAVVLSGVLLVGTAVVMFIGVVFRYGLNNALPWTDELAEFMLVWTAFVGAVVAFVRGYHPAIMVVTKGLRGRVRSAVDLAREALVGSYLLLLLVAGWGLATASHLPHAVALPLSYTVPFAAIPVSAGLMLVQWLRGLTVRTPRFAGAGVVVAVAVAWVLLRISQSPPAWLTVAPLGAVMLLLPVLFALGAPIAIVLGLFSLAALAIQGGVPLTIVAQRLYAGIDNPAFLAIPAFMLAGALMEVTGMSRSLVAFASALVGRFQGGLALADVVASVLFADTSGSAVADTAAIGSVMMPGMRSRGYRESFVAAHQAASGSLGTLFPPSISMIIFATVTSVSVVQLFQSSILPGGLVAGSYMLVAYLVARWENYPRERPYALREFVRVIGAAIPALVAPAVILGGILFGVFAPYEAGAVAVVYVLAVGVITNIRRHPAHYGRAILQAVQMTSMVMFIIANATILAWVLISVGLPQAVAAAIGRMSHTPIVVLLLVSLFLICLSVFLEPPAILVAVVPIVLPLVQALGVDPYQFGVVVMLAGAIGMLLPPIGITLLVSISVLGTPVEQAAKAAIPYMLVALCDLVLVILFPALTAWLPHLAHAGR